MSMGSSIRVWFLGTLAFSAVFLLCLDRHWGFISAAKGTPERHIDASAMQMSVAPPTTVARQPEPLQQEVDALLDATVIEFETGSAALRRPSGKVLGQIATFLAAHPEVRVRIEGHTDGSGPADENRALSERRAESVMAALVALGVDPGRIATAGFGSSRPLTPERTAGDRARNRRIQLTLSR
jgi:outer membrane protein OmpA-like peptidoglycan-associated protein